MERQAPVDISESASQQADGCGRIGKMIVKMPDAVGFEALSQQDRFRKVEK